MSLSISSATPVAAAQPGTPVQRAEKQREPAESKAHTAGGGTDTVQLSNTAQALLAARKEAAETPAQTAQEAAGGDNQARRLLVTEAAAKSVTK